MFWVLFSRLCPKLAIVAEKGDTFTLSFANCESSTNRVMKYYVLLPKFAKNTKMKESAGRNPALSFSQNKTFCFLGFCYKANESSI